MQNRAAIQDDDLALHTKKSFMYQYRRSGGIGHTLLPLFVLPDSQSLRMERPVGVENELLVQ